MTEKYTTQIKNSFEIPSSRTFELPYSQNFKKYTQPYCPVRGWLFFFFLAVGVWGGGTWAPD